MVNTWEEFINLLETNQSKFKYNIKKYWIDKSQGFYEDYIEITYNGVTLFINDEFKEVTVVEKTMNGTYEIQIAFNCTYDRYVKLISVIFDIDIEV